ncbi:hypothetical protein EIP86_000667 [Pleurotus ostreatoroseus]|nr:hypothetical protein EIP86_000667 [Pleurotus ostreatoroseus]
MPPGPDGLPVVGNLIHLPADRYWLKIDEWIRQHGQIQANSLLRVTLFMTHCDVAGSIITLNLLGKRIVVLGSAKVAGDLLGIAGTAKRFTPD